jgi:hyaluronan synthase
VHRSPENRGKRFAQAWGFDQAQTDIVVTVDSDTVLQSDAIAEIVKPFADRRVNGVCGYARGLNRRRNLLTRLIDLRYTNSFLYERGAYSVLGSVLCSTGVLSAWRREVVLDNREDYLNQRFLGTEVHYGDDRRLTAYALRTGRVVLQDTAVALTHVPERMSHFLKQQVRWNKSFFRESLLLLRQSRPTRIAWWLGLAEFGYWMVLTTMLLYAVAVRPIVSGVAPTWHYAAFVALMAYARSIRMIGDGGRPFPAAFLLAPVYGVMNLLLLVPLRFYSLLRLRDGSWGTRKRRRGISRREAAALAAAPVAAAPVLAAPMPSAPVAAAPVLAAPVASAPVAGAAAVAPAPVAPPMQAQARTGRACVNVLAD